MMPNARTMRLRHVFELRFLRFLLVGIVNTAFSYGVYAALLWVGLNYALANLIALLLGIAFSFKTQGRIVFRNPDNGLIGIFAASWLVIYLLNIALIHVFMSLGLDAYAAGLVALPMMVALSYVAQRYVVFRAAAPGSPPAGGPRHGDDSTR